MWFKCGCGLDVGVVDSINKALTHEIGCGLNVGVVDDVFSS